MPKKAEQGEANRKLEQANTLYLQVMQMAQDWKNIDVPKAQLIIEYSKDAIESFGSTNQEKKIELKRIMENAEQVIPPDSIDSFKKRAEKIILKVIYPKKPKLRNALLVILGLAIFLSIAAPLYLQLIKGDDSSKKEVDNGNQIKKEERGAPSPAAQDQVANSSLESKALTPKQEIVKPDLKIVDVLTPSPSVVEFKLKNSGNDSAFLKSIRFVFEPNGTRGCDSCAPQTAFVYTVEAKIKDKKIVIEPKYADKVTGKIVKPPEDLRESQEAYDFTDKNKFVVDRSSALKISQVVPPRGVDRFQVKFNAPKLMPDEYYIFHGYAIIEFDENGEIRTPRFDIEIRD